MKTGGGRDRRVARGRDNQTTREGERGCTHRDRGLPLAEAMASDSTFTTSRTLLTAESFAKSRRCTEPKRHAQQPEPTPDSSPPRRRLPRNWPRPSRCSEAFGTITTRPDAAWTATFATAICARLIDFWRPPRRPSQPESETKPEAAELPRSPPNPRKLPIAGNTVSIYTISRRNSNSITLSASIRVKPTAPSVWTNGIFDAENS